MNVPRACLLIALLTSVSSAVAQSPTSRPASGLRAKPTPAEIAAARRAVLRRLRPLPPNTPRTIMNPYWAKPAWKLWAVDPSPVTVDRSGLKGTFEPIPADKRKYPTFPETWTKGFPPLEPSEKPAVAGSWDDAYMSLDHHHTRLRSPRGQFIDAGAMRHSGDSMVRLMLGVNFTSQSYSHRGRHIVDDTLNNLNTEKFFFFANCVRATPCHASYNDNKSEMAKDDYDGLFAHSYQSVGQSGSEMYALEKMMIAGACLPRETKDLLKRHGAYGIVLLTLFKAALPFDDADGRPVPYENELRHRPAYSSHGTPQHAHYCSANVPYHAYDNDRHIRNMVALARGMTSPPPVTILKPQKLTIRKDGEEIKDKRDLAGRVKGLSLTNVRIWGQPGETIELLVSLKDSYDFQGRDLTFTCQPVYPNQENVTVEQVTPGAFLITVKYDPKLPKGRIPVICVARNGREVPGNPAFVNVYFPGENEQDDYPNGRVPRGSTTKKQLPVNVNPRPVVDLGQPGGVVHCHPGRTVRVDLKAKDPDGYPVRIYRWPGQVGKIEGQTLVYTAPKDAKPGLHPVNLVFSDGTGGFTGKRIEMAVQDREDAMPAGWQVSPLGSVTALGTVAMDGDEIEFRGQPVAAKSKDATGMYLYRDGQGPVDLTLVPADTDAPLGLMVRKQLGFPSRRLWIGRQEGKVRAVFQPAENRWGFANRDPGETPGVTGKEYRMIWRDDRVGGFLSDGGTTYRQIIGEKLDLPETYVIGVTYGGGEKPARCVLKENAASSLPIVAHIGKPPDRRTGKLPLPQKLEIIRPDAKATVRYTLDGSAPTADSPAYDKPITLTDPGWHEVRAAVFTDGKPGPVVVAVYDIAEPQPKKK